MFGCIGHVHIPSQIRIKLDARSHKCVLMGISSGSKAYRLYDPIQKKIVISRDVIFEEDQRWNWDAEFEEQQELIIDSEVGPRSETLVEQLQEQQPQEDELNDESPTFIADPDQTTVTSPVGEPSTRIKRTPIWMQDYRTGEELSENEVY